MIKLKVPPIHTVSLIWRLPRSVNGTVRSSHFPSVEKKKEGNYQFLLVRTVGAAINLYYKDNLITLFFLLFCALENKEKLYEPRNV